MIAQTLTVLALIPARGGSKGVPGKNIRPIGGRTLLQRAIDAARDSGVVDRILVSTDSEEIAEAALKAGVEVPFLRPPELASDQAPMGPTIRHAITEFESHAGVTIDTLVFTEPTTPFRTATHVEQAVRRFRRGDCLSVITVCPVERKPENIFVKDADGHLERYIREPHETFANRQEMNALCRLSSGVYVVGRDTYLSNNRLVVEPVGFIEMTAIESANIDEQIDLMLAELISERYGL